MAAFTARNTSTVMTPKTFLDVIRKEGDAVDVNRMGFNYIMAREGTFEDFKAARITFIRRAQEAGKGGRSGGKVTYTQLVAEGKTNNEIEKIFNSCRRKVEAMKPGSYRHKMSVEYAKMRAKWDVDKWNNGNRIDGLSSHLEKFSQTNKPKVPTGFCAAVGRMMILVRSYHVQEMTDAANIKAREYHIQKNIANNKRVTKHNAMKNSMGLAAWNAKKQRDQAASEARKAAEVSARPKQESDFLNWRRSAAGRVYDRPPKEEYVTSLSHRVGTINAKKSLGYTSRAVLAQLVKKSVLDRRNSNLEITFYVDPCDAKTQLYQHVAMLSGVSPLSKTQEVSSNRTFRITGYFQQSEFFVNLDNMRASVYIGLPTKYKAFEAWEKYGVMGNPKKSTMMNILFKITPYNINTFSFVQNGTQYTAEYTSNYTMQSSLGKLEAKMRDTLDTAAAAAALLAEEEKRRRGQEARRAAIAAAQRKKNGISTKTNKSVKAMLTRQLAEGKIDMEAFKMGMSALD